MRSIRYDVTIVLVCHFNKPDGNVENAFNIHKIAGGSYLANWSEHIQIICNTNQDNLRLFRTVKSRGTEFSKAVYGLEWGGVDKQLLSMDGLYSNWYLCRVYAHLNDKENAVFHNDRSKECLNNMAVLNKNNDHADSFIHKNYY